MMRPKRTLLLLPLLLLLFSCGGEDSQGEKIEKEAERSAEKAADRSLDKLNESEEDSSETDSSAQ